MTVDRADLEAKLREIEGVVTDVEEDVTSGFVSTGILAGAIVIGLVVLIVWTSRRSKIRVEVYSQ